MNIENVCYLPSGRVFLVRTKDDYLIECTEMRDVAIDGKLHQEVRESTDPHLIWKHLVDYKKKWLLTVSTQKGCTHACEMCFLPKTQVYNVTGTKSIEEIKINDTVLGKDLENNKLEKQTVTNVNSRYYKGEILEIEMEDGKTIRVTPEHPFYTQRGWVFAQDLCETDKLIEIHS